MLLGCGYTVIVENRFVLKIVVVWFRLVRVQGWLLLYQYFPSVLDVYAAFSGV